MFLHNLLGLPLGVKTSSAEGGVGLPVTAPYLAKLGIQGIQDTRGKFVGNSGDFLNPAYMSRC